ncbi:hypothetical protein ACSBR2_026660 [Camellia fascicularis]
MELLGVAPTQQDFIGSSLKLKWIADHFYQLPHDTTDEMVHHYARAYIMWLFGGILAPDKSKKYSEDDVFATIKRLRPSPQVWVWEGLVCIAPSRKSNIGDGERAIGEGYHELPPAPRACRWRVPFSHEVISTNVNVIFRDQFDHMIEEEFIWEPYEREDDIITDFPLYCTIG